ncbi:MAG: PTS sugar transporter subunit IIA [Chthoniobacterales bacterium]|nr:PTS sugar transporter subunit IIA [Chthoniobacterales bacterium]
MTLASLLKLERIVPEFEAEDRWQAIQKLVDFLVDCGGIRAEDRDTIYEALKRREESISTGIGHGVAIPHIPSECVSEVVVVFARSRKGIEFDAQDNQLVYFVVLFIVPRENFKLHLNTLAAIARSLMDRNVREELAAAEGREGILQVLKRHSK